MGVGVAVCFFCGGIFVAAMRRKQMRRVIEGVEARMREKGTIIPPVSPRRRAQEEVLRRNKEKGEETRLEELS